jgi:uncharacterized protein with HEPN domain
MQVKDRARLMHMFEAARNVERFTSGKTIDRFYEDEILRLALTTLFQNIGEAARKISDEFKLEHPEIEWDDIIGFRHRLVHGYDVIDYDIMWGIIQNNIPELLMQLRKLDLVEKSF